jgi:hypothetical protein
MTTRSPRALAVRISSTVGQRNLVGLPAHQHRASRDALGPHTGLDCAAGQIDAGEHVARRLDVAPQ